MKESYDFSSGKSGPVMPTDLGKTRITIRLDNDVIDWFRQQVNEAGGGNYQTQMNAALRHYINNARGTGLEETLRRVVREELRAAG
jgi:uncharacterized protein (DUF4415 family)